MNLFIFYNYYYYHFLYSNNLRSTRAAGVEQQDEDNVDDFLGYENEAFKFEHLPNPISFIECELKSGNADSGVSEIKDWMIENY